MKKLLLLPVLCLSLTAGAQNSIALSNNDDQTAISANTAIMLGTHANSNHKFNIDVTNNSNANKKYLAKRYDKVLNAGASAYYCFAGQCYTQGTFQSPDTLYLNPGQSASQNTLNPNFILTADLDEGPAAGYSLIRYTFFDAFNHDDSAQVSLIYNSPVGIAEAKKNLKSVELFPNPSEGNTTLLISAQAAFYGKVQVFNSLGDLVNEQNTAFVQGNNKIELSLGDLAPGIYLVNVKAGNNGLVTKRLVIK